MTHFAFCSCRQRGSQLRLCAVVILYISTAVFWFATFKETLLSIRSGWKLFLPSDEENMNDFADSLNVELVSLSCTVTSSLSINVRTDIMSLSHRGITNMVDEL